jgi:ACS family glucarate transporter-like MFS transporter
MRFAVLAATAFVAFNMYLDRACLASVKVEAGQDLGLDSRQEDWLVSAFFWTYALAQVPAAWLSRRIGIRTALTLYCVLWSAFTVVTGLATGFAVFLAARFLVGLSEAGAYPTASAVVRNWFPVEARGRANSVVTFGGRFGLVIALVLTPTLVDAFDSWRTVLIIYGCLGLVAALFFGIVVREGPNNATVAYEPIPFRALITSRNVWLASVHQFGLNFGWVFLITKMPEYFTLHFGVSKEDRGMVALLPAIGGCVGMLFGGLVVDGLTKRYGLRIGRVVPLSGWLVVAAIAYLFASQQSVAWAAAIAIAVMAFAGDAANPAYWSFSQDIGKQHAAATLGFGNMIGNFGAAFSPIVLGYVQIYYGWSNVFLLAAGTFLISAVFALFLNPHRALLDPTRSEQA